MPRLPLALAALLAGPAPLAAEPFTIFIWETPAAVALRADPGEAGQDYWSAFAEYGQVLAAEGGLRGGAPLLVAPGDAGGDGLILGGYFQIDAPDLGAAQALAERSPAATTGGRAVVTAEMPSGAMMAE